MQITEQEILIVVASLAVHCCVIKKNIIVASKLGHSCIKVMSL